MNNILDEASVYITIDKKRVSYSRMYMDQQIVNYFPNYNQSEINPRETNVVFLPISQKTFNTVSKHRRFYGYMYMFASAQLNAPIEGEGIEELSHVQLTSDVRRFKFHIENKEIKIEKIYSSIYPPRILDINFPTKLVGLEILKIMKDLIDEFNLHYINKEV